MLLQNSINWLVWRASSSYARAATVLASVGMMRAAAKWGCGGTDSVQAIPKGDFFLSPLPNASSFSFGMNFSKSTQAAQHLLLYVQLWYRLASEFLVSGFWFLILFLFVWSCASVGNVYHVVGLKTSALRLDKLLQKNIPNHYPELLITVNGTDEMPILYFFYRLIACTSDKVVYR